MATYTRKIKQHPSKRKKEQRKNAQEQITDSHFGISKNGMPLYFPVKVRLSCKFKRLIRGRRYALTR